MITDQLLVMTWPLHYIAANVSYGIFLPEMWLEINIFSWFISDCYPYPISGAAHCFYTAVSLSFELCIYCRAKTKADEACKR